MTTVLDAPVDPSSEPLVLQFDVKFNEGLSCGGAYMKFLTQKEGFSAEDLKEDTPYTVMFGPDKCGSTDKVHLIIRHAHPVTGEIEEKHLNSPPMVKDDKVSHTYTAILNPKENTYEILIDGESEKSGSLLEDFTPSFIPPEEIVDPEDKKPEDWVDDAKIPDPDAVKPDDWDEDAPQFIPDEDATKPEGWLDDEPKDIPDPDAEKPEDWDDEEDGDWEPPTIPNPKCEEAPGCGEWTQPTKPNPEYKGKWRAPLIDNPEYKGPWTPRKIPNPDFHQETDVLSRIGKVGAVAIEIWTMDENYFFDNVVVTNSPEEAGNIRSTHWTPKYEIEKAAADKKAKEEEAAFKDQVQVTWINQLRGNIIDRIEDFFVMKPLLPYADQLMPIRDALEQYPLTVLAVLCGIITLPLALIALKFVSAQRKAAAIGAAKKNDDAPKSQKKTAATKKKEEIEEEEDDEDEKPSGSARRRNIPRD